METLVSKISFSDFHSFVNEHLGEIGDAERVYQNQVIGLTQRNVILAKNRDSLRCIMAKLAEFKAKEENLSFMLNKTEQIQNAWMNILDQYEAKYGADLAGAPLDQAREFYAGILCIFSQIETLREAVAGVEREVVHERCSNTEHDSYYAFGRVLTDNLHVLQNVFLQMEKLKTDMVRVESMWNRYLNKRNPNCFC